jgi:hypothetical protein
MEQCAIRQQHAIFDGKGKKPVGNSLLSGKVKEKEKRKRKGHVPVAKTSRKL